MVITIPKFYCKKCKQYFYGWARPICPVCGGKLEKAKEV